MRRYSGLVSHLDGSHLGAAVDGGGSRQGSWKKLCLESCGGFGFAALRCNAPIDLLVESPKRPVAPCLSMGSTSGALPANLENGCADSGFLVRSDGGDRRIGGRRFPTDTTIWHHHPWIHGFAFPLASIIRTSPAFDCWCLPRGRLILASSLCSKVSYTRRTGEYPAGSRGPKEADDLLGQDGHEWRLL